MTVLPEIVKGLLGVSPMTVFNWISEYSLHVIDTMGGFRMVALLAIAGFILGFLACLYKIKYIEIER